MLYELYKGRLLFPTKNFYQHLALIRKRLNKEFDARLITQSDKKDCFEKTEVA